MKRQYTADDYARRQKFINSIHRLRNHTTPTPAMSHIRPGLANALAAYWCEHIPEADVLVWKKTKKKKPTAQTDLFNADASTPSDASTP